MRSSFRMGAERYWTISLVVGLLTAGHARGDIVDGIRALGDSIAVWQTAPPAWDVTPLDDDWDGVVRDTLDARGDSVLIRYPALYENRFISTYLEIQKAGEKGYSVLSEWQDSVWVVSGQAVGTADEGWSDSNLQDYFRARLLQLRLLLHANLKKVNVPLFGDTVSVELTLVGRDIQRFTMSHDAALGIVRHISGGALSHAFNRQRGGSFRKFHCVPTHVICSLPGLTLQTR